MQLHMNFIETKNQKNIYTKHKNEKKSKHTSKNIHITKEKVGGWGLQKPSENNEKKKLNMYVLVITLTAHGLNPPKVIEWLGGLKTTHIYAAYNIRDSLHT